MEGREAGARCRAGRAEPGRWLGGSCKQAGSTSWTSVLLLVPTRITRAQRASCTPHPAVVLARGHPDTRLARCSAGAGARGGAGSQRAVTAEAACPSVRLLVRQLKPTREILWFPLGNVCCALLPNLPFCKGPQFTFMKNANCRVIWCDEHLQMIPSVSSK